ncbi:phage DNA ejection protein [Escherichia coli]|nr:phage DNA ejection protein [Escherichia coli]
MAYSIGSPLNLMSLVPDFRLEGLKEAQTFATTQQGIAQGIDNQRAIRQDARQQEFYKAMNETPPEQIASLRRKFPEFTQAIQQELGIQSAEHSAFVNSALNKISIAASTGNPNEIANALNSNSAALLSLGVSKDDAWQLYQQDPGRFNSLLNASRLATLPMDKQFDVQHQRDQLNEQIRQADMENARGWASNNIAQQNVNLRRMELEDKKYDRLIANETNALKLAELQDKRLQNQQAMEQAKRDKADAYNSGMDNLSRTIETATKVLNSPGFTGYFGTNLNPLSSRFIPGTEAADTETLVDTLKSQGFLSGIQQMKGMGALSNAEGQKVMDAIGSLSPNQSEKSARAAIKTIIKTTEMAQKRMQQKYGKDIQPSQQQLSDDELINKYLGGQ